MTLPPPPSPFRSTWALMTRRDPTWRQAGEGWAVVVALGSGALAVAGLVKVARSINRARRQVT